LLENFRFRHRSQNLSTAARQVTGDATFIFIASEHAALLADERGRVSVDDQIVEARNAQVG
jgi:hypothetical protein